MALTSTQVANLAIANQNAIGQYGSNRNNALTGNSIGTSNALGQMTNGYFNAMGQLGTAAGAYGAAGQAAAANTNRGNAVGGILGGLGGGGGSYGGGNFNVTSPGGQSASGSYGGGGSGANTGSSWQQPPQAQFDNNSMMSFFNNTRDAMGASGGFADKARQNVYDTGSGTRQDIMSPDIMSGLNTNYGRGMTDLDSQDKRAYQERKDLRADWDYKQSPEYADSMRRRQDATTQKYETDQFDQQRDAARKQYGAAPGMAAGTFYDNNLYYNGTNLVSRGRPTFSQMTQRRY